jgi:hypothetical protein
VVEHLLSKSKALNSNPNTIKTHNNNNKRTERLSLLEMKSQTALEYHWKRQYQVLLTSIPQESFRALGSGI